MPAGSYIPVFSRDFSPIAHGKQRRTFNTATLVASADSNMVYQPDINPGSAGTTAVHVDEAFMSGALELAWQAAGKTNPNPLVGAVIVKDGVVVGEGFHHRCGQAHAEVEAMRQAGDLARGATMYVTLEPCAHHGRTPPCAEQLVAAGIRRVVMPTIDPDPKVRGRGVEMLRSAGIQADTGCANAAAIATNIAYYKQRLGLGPTVVLKMALTIDGKIASAPGRRDQVSGEASHHYVHRLRANSDGIVVGINTVQTDAPRLDCRLVDCGAAPVPVVLDGNLDLDADNRWIREGRPFVVVGDDSNNSSARADALREGGGRVLSCASDGEGRVDVAEAMRLLSGAGFERILVEGGGQLFTSFLRAGLWDAMFLFHSPRAFGPGGVPVFTDTDPADPDAISIDATRLEGDFLHRYVNRRTYDEIVAKLK